jgi:hypothetical protein
MGMGDYGLYPVFFSEHPHEQPSLIALRRLPISIKVQAVPGPVLRE